MKTEIRIIEGNGGKVAALPRYSSSFKYSFDYPPGMKVVLKDGSVTKILTWIEDKGLQSFIEENGLTFPWYTIRGEYLGKVTSLKIEK